MKIMNRLAGFIPISRRKFIEFVKELNLVLEAYEVNDRQHCQIEHGLIKNLEIVQGNKTTEEEKKKSDKGRIGYQ